MVSFSDMEKVLRWSKDTGAKITIIFAGIPYRLQIYKLFRATDNQGRFVSWTKAFGTKQPHQVVDTFKVEMVRISWPDGREETLDDFKKLLEKIA